MTYESLQNEIAQYFSQQKAYLAYVKRFNATDLLDKPDQKRWSVAECLEHLNLTFNHYLPAIETGFSKLKPNKKVSANYKISYFPKLLINGLKPSEKGKISMKMKTFKVTTPLPIEDPLKTIEKFEHNFAELERYFKDAKPSDFQRVKVVSLIGSILTFKLGDCFLFLLAHQERHFQQMNNVINQLDLTSGKKEIV